MSHHLHGSRVVRAAFRCDGGPHVVMQRYDVAPLDIGDSQLAHPGVDEQHHRAAVFGLGARPTVGRDVFLEEPSAKTALASAVEAILREDFVDRILPFDSEAAREYADIAAARRSAGRPFPPADCQIAAIARSRGMTVATRNVRDFEDIEVEVVDPWTAA